MEDVNGAQGLKAIANKQNYVREKETLSCRICL